MEHYYVITGNDYGADLDTKKNFNPILKDEAYQYFELVKKHDYACVLVHVDSYGNEKVLRKQFNE